jgi:predicted ATPase/signal transduction histidine kinase
MIDLSSYALQELGSDGTFVLTRATPARGGPRLLMVSQASEVADRGAVEQLERAISLRDELDAGWATRPVELQRFRGRTCLLTEDPGAEPLQQLLGPPMPPRQFLRIAIGLAKAVGELHARGLTHRDLKPSNVLVDPATGRCWLAGLGMASRRPRERQAPDPFEVIPGTLTHIAPERTGRVNRSADSRSDLYSVGVVLYEMLTGRLPFAAATPLEWVHCHIARQPAAPVDVRASLPRPLSDIVMRLLAKPPEDRYQTASGLVLDLVHCLDEWEARETIEPFALGLRDVSDRFLVPETLYGRSREIEVLLASFERVVKSGKTELVLVSGYSGIGKSSVVNELHKALVPPRGLFASGKFDQYKRGIPYATLALAFQRLVRHVLAQSESDVVRWRSALQEALGANGQLIVGLIPEIERLIGPQPPVADLPPQDSKNRFHQALRRFIGVFARPEHPLALFLDDLQWLDTATLELIEDLVLAPDVSSLMLVGAYRDNEVDANHPLTRVVRNAEQSGASVHELVLGPIAIDDVRAFVVDALRCDEGEAQSLARFVFDKTGGNPFFMIQFVSVLAETGLLFFDHGSSRWKWDLAQIAAQPSTDNVLVLMRSKLGRLPEPTQGVLRQFACVGNAVAVETLGLVCGCGEEELQRDLKPALEAELVFRTGPSYTFLHDRVQEAAYALLPEDRRPEMHLRIGRILAARATPEEAAERIFDVVDQLNRGMALITSGDERETVAHFNLVAARRAKASTAHVSARAYLVAGLSLLSEDARERQGSLAFELGYELADCDFILGEPASAEERLRHLAAKSGSLADQARVTCLQVMVYTALDRSDRAVGVCFEFLGRVGIDWPMHPSPELARAEYDAMWKRMGARTPDALLNLPRNADPDSRATIEVLSAVQPAALYIDHQLGALVVCRIVNLSLDHGNCDASCFAYVCLAMLIGPVFGAYDQAHPFGKLALDLVERPGFERFKARVLLCFGNMVSPWREDARIGRRLVLRAFDVARETGDPTFAVYSCNNLVTNMLLCGDPLPDVQRAAEDGFEFTRKARINLAEVFITGQLRLILTLRGLLPTFGGFDGPSFEEAAFERVLEANPSLSMARCWYWIRKLQAKLFASDVTAALSAAEIAGRLLWTSPSFLETSDYHLYAALAHAAQHEVAAEESRAEHLRSLRAHQAEIELEARNGPENFENRAQLLAAEVARIEGRHDDAIRLYEDAIRSARKSALVNGEALASELASRCHAALGLETSARAYLLAAIGCYERWGAHGKVRDLRERHAHLLDDRAARPPRLESSLGALDMATVVRMSLAVSAEIVLERLIETLMTIVIEHAGATHGLLVVPKGEMLQVEAEATTSADSISVVLRRTGATPLDMPESMLRFVVRSHESALLNDAVAANDFSSDAYFMQKRVRSVVCIPLVKQGRLIGVLYLENHLSAGAFTPPRVAVLQLLASQAAVSLENANLYANLSDTEANLRKAQSELAHVTRVTTMGALAASIAHEVGQPISSMIASGDAALRWLARSKDDAEAAAETRAAMEAVVRDGARARSIVDRIRALFKKKEPLKEPVDINDAVEEVLMLLRNELDRRSVVFRRELSPEVPGVIGDRVQLQQVIMNLVLNAADAMANVQDRPRSLTIGTKLAGQDEVLTFVTDSGVGIDPANINQLFAAFHTTKANGLGMGLSISRSIVESHDGRLWACPNDGAGATFQFTLRAAAPAQPKLPKGGSLASRELGAQAETRRETHKLGDG